MDYKRPLTVRTDTHQGLEGTNLEIPGGGRQKQRQSRQREPPDELLQKVNQVWHNFYKWF